MRLRLFIFTAGVAAAGATLACSDSTGISSTTYVATMTGANERPTANASTASGTAVYVLTGRQLTYTISVNGLSAAASGAHIHVGGSTIAGPVVVPFTVSATQSGVVSSGTIDLTYPVVSGSSSISGDSLKVLLEDGNAYTNVHNSSFPGGELRGQITRQ